MEAYPAYKPPKRKGFCLDPRTKILFMGLVTTLLFFVHENIAFVSVLAGIPFIFLLMNGQRKTALIYGGLFILGVFANFAKNAADLPQALNAILVLLIALVLRLFPTFMMGYYMIESTKAGEFITAMERWHISKNFIIPLAVVFRFVPTIGEESRSITDAMRMRRIQFGTKKFMKNPGAFLEYRVIPLMVSIVKIGDELSAAALTRGLGNSVKRESIAVVGFGPYDFIVFGASVALLLGLFI